MGFIALKPNSQSSKLFYSQVNITHDSNSTVDAARYKNTVFLGAHFVQGILVLRYPATAFVTHMFFGYVKRELNNNKPQNNIHAETAPGNSHACNEIDEFSCFCCYFYIRYGNKNSNNVKITNLITRYALQHNGVFFNEFSVKRIIKKESICEKIRIFSPPSFYYNI